MTGAAWLYGSLARGDWDADSDTDILVVTTDNATTLDVRDLIAPDRIPSISQYSWNEMVGMAAYGSLFLHHIRLEGRPLYEDNVVQGLLRLILDHLPPYQRASSDVKAFRLAIQDVRHSMSRGGSTVFEASVLATVLRHSAILGCYVGGFPNFGRAEPVSRVVSAWKLNPAIAARFLDLYQFRIRPPSRPASPQGLAPSEVLEWCDNIDSVLEALEENVDAYERGLQKKDLALVIEAAESPEAAYLARIRLKRLILNCSRTIAQESGIAEPVLPGPFEAPSASSPVTREIAAVCSRLSESAEILCQPSEPLNDRWRRGWGDVYHELEQLDTLLSYRASAEPC